MCAIKAVLCACAGVALGYSQLTDNDILDLPVPQLQTAGFLFIWVINAKYKFTLDLFERWGYTCAIPSSLPLTGPIKGALLLERRIGKAVVARWLQRTSNAAAQRSCQVQATAERRMCMAQAGG